MQGPRPIYYIFLIGGIVLWYFVGRALDKVRESATPNRPNHRLVRIVAHLFLLIWGIILIFLAMKYFLPLYPGQRHSASMLVYGLIVLAWALILILIPVWNLRKGIK
jgi:hypothetical protein